jgi:hypothetical protein
MAKLLPLLANGKNFALLLVGSKQQLAHFVSLSFSIPPSVRLILAQLDRDHSKKNLRTTFSQTLLRVLRYYATQIRKLVECLARAVGQHVKTPRANNKHRA